jgi:hypothetical protein
VKQRSPGALSRGFFGAAAREPRGLESARLQAHILAMEAFIKIALLAALVVLTLGVIPDRRRGAAIAVRTCVVAAFALHFVAP